jgi:hypothetical protein
VRSVFNDEKKLSIAELSQTLVVSEDVVDFVAALAV